MSSSILNRAFLIISIFMVAVSIVELDNPDRRFSQQNNEQRRRDLRIYLRALERYSGDHNSFPETIIKDNLTIKKYNGVDLCNYLAPKYLEKLPYDPNVGNFDNCDSFDTGYLIRKGPSGNIILSAPAAQLGEKVELSE